MHSPPNLEAKYKGINKKVPWKIIIYNHNLKLNKLPLEQGLS